MSPRLFEHGFRKARRSARRYASRAMSRRRTRSPLESLAAVPPCARPPRARGSGGARGCASGRSPRPTYARALRAIGRLRGRPLLLPAIAVGRRPRRPRAARRRHLEARLDRRHRRLRLRPRRSRPARDRGASPPRATPSSRAICCRAPSTCASRARCCVTPVAGFATSGSRSRARSPTRTRSR